MWTAVPPAKSSDAELGERSSRRRPAAEVEDPVRDREVDQVTQHDRRRRSQPANLARSAIAPLISAGVMMANIIWKADEHQVGIG